MSPGQQVGGALDPRELAAEGLRQGLGQRRLAQAGQVLDEQVPPRQQAGQHVLDHVRLAAQRAVQRGADPVDRAGTGSRSSTVVASSSSRRASFSVLERVASRKRRERPGPHRATGRFAGCRARSQGGGQSRPGRGRGRPSRPGGRAPRGRPELARRPAAAIGAIPARERQPRRPRAARPPRPPLDESRPQHAAAAGRVRGPSAEAIVASRRATSRRNRTAADEPSDRQAEARVCRRPIAQAEPSAARRSVRTRARPGASARSRGSARRRPSARPAAGPRPRSGRRRRSPACAASAGRTARGRVQAADDASRDSPATGAARPPTRRTGNRGRARRGAGTRRRRRCSRRGRGRRSWV